MGTLSVWGDAGGTKGEGGRDARETLGARRDQRPHIIETMHSSTLPM